MNRVWMKTTAYSPLVLILLFAGCSTFWGGSKGDTFIDSKFNPEQEAAENRLREIVSEYITAEQLAGDKSTVPVIKRRPYYFKEYVVFPDGNDGFTVDFRENDSRVRSLVAEVKVNKVRYSTRMHRKRGAAEADNDFLRDTGVETLVYELRSGRWVRTGTVFDANKTEEMANGEWIPRREETQRVVPAEERPGFFKRIWMRIRGEKE